MKISKTLAGLAMATTVTIGSAGAAFASDGSGTPRDDRAERVANRCAKAPEVEKRITDRLTKLNTRLTKLQDALKKAEPGSERAKRIQHRIDQVQHRIDRLTKLQGKIKTWVDAHCTAGAAA